MQGEKKQINPDKNLSIYQNTESCISLELVSNSTLPDSLLKAFKDWDIHTLFLNNDTLNKLELQKAYKEGAFDDFSVFFNFDPDIKSYLADHPDLSEQILRTRIFSGNAYMRRQKNWGCDLFHFYGNKPEIIPIRRKIKDLHIEDPESIFRLFYTTTLTDQQDLSLTDVTDLYDRQTQRIEPQATDGYIIVMRQYRLSAADTLNQRINYFENTHLKRILKIFSTRVRNRLGDLQNLQFDFDTLFTGIQDNLHVDFHPEFSATEIEFIEQVMRFWLYPQPVFAAYGQAFNRYFKTILKPELDQYAQQVFYRVAVSNPMINSLELDSSFLLSIDEHQFQSNTPYYEQAITQLKRAESRRTSQGISGMPVAIHHLLNLDFSFSEKLEQFNHLLVYGANQFHFRFDIQKEISSKLHIIDPSYAAYDHWFNRLNFAGRLLSKGIPLTELLILYPGLDNDLNMFNQTMTEIRISGLDFTLLDFDLFNNEETCPIESDSIGFAGQKFNIILLPAINVIGLETLKKLAKFIEAGGKVIAIGRVPEKGLITDAEVEFIKLNQQIWFEGNRSRSTSFKEVDSGGASYFQADISKLSNLLDNFEDRLNVCIDSDHAGIHYRLREMEEHYTLFIANLSSQQRIAVDFSARLEGRPFYWDFNTNKAKPLANWFRDAKERLHCRMNLPPGQAEFILINKRTSAESWQVLESDLDSFHFDEENILSGLKRKSGNSIVSLKREDQFLKVPVRITGKLPILTISNKNWLIDSENFNGAVDLGDYSRLFPFRSGSITYHKLIVIEEIYFQNQRLLLSLGNLKDWCSLTVNDKFVGERYEAPWEFDISQYLNVGENRLSIKITNTLSNRLAGENEIYKVRDYGLFGPVKIIPSSRVVIALDAEMDV